MAVFPTKRSGLREGCEHGQPHKHLLCTRHGLNVLYNEPSQLSEADTTAFHFADAATESLRGERMKVEPAYLQQNQDSDPGLTLGPMGV